MKILKRTLLFDIFKSLDLTIITVSLLIASRLNILNFNLQNIILISVFLLGGYFCLKNTGAYSSKRFRAFPAEIRSCLYTALFSGIIFLITGIIFNLSFVSTNTIIFYMIICFLLLSVDRLLLFMLLEIAVLYGRNLRNVLIAGTNERAMNLAKELPKLGYVIKGFIDEKWQIEPYDSILLITDYQKAFRELHIDEVIICLPLKTEYSKIQTIINSTEEQGILTRLSTDLFDLKIAKAKIEYFDNIPLLTIFTGNMYKEKIFIKEIFDRIAASISLLILLPLFLLVAIAIKLTSKGPIFFLQNRLGMNKKLFKVIKFRTMVPDAEAKLKNLEHLNERKGEGAFKIKKDPRIIPIGKILRKFSLDELPQLVNVIKGDMSLVGPRPLPERDYQHFQEDWQRRRFSVKPGITGLWQISGRNNINFKTWMQLDNLYIDTWTLLLDLKILFKTIPAVITGNGGS